MTYPQTTLQYRPLSGVGNIPSNDLMSWYSNLGVPLPANTSGLGLAPSVMPGNPNLGSTANLATDPNWAGVPNWAKIDKIGKNPGSGPSTGGTGFGWNLGTMKVGVDALAAIGGLYNAFQSNKLAKDQFAFTKEVTNTNLNNQIKTYNTTLEDRALARGRLNGEADPSAYAAAYTDKNKISRG